MNAYSSPLWGVHFPKNFATVCVGVVGDVFDGKQETTMAVNGRTPPVWSKSICAQRFGRGWHVGGLESPPLRFHSSELMCRENRFRDFERLTIFLI